VKVRKRLEMFCGGCRLGLTGFSFGSFVDRRRISAVAVTASLAAAGRFIGRSSRSSRSRFTGLSVSNKLERYDIPNEKNSEV
jgi:hypothetical protein